MRKICVAIIVIVLTCCCGVLGRDALRLQKLSIYSDNCCKGKGEIYTGNVRELGEVSMILSKGQMKSFSVHRGLWALSPEANYTKHGVYYEGGQDEIEGNCGSSASGGGGGDYIQYKAIRYVGNSIVDLPGLSLFTSGSFFGEELYFDGTGLRLPNPYIFKSYGFTGKEKWTIFPYVNYTGGSSCLIPQNKVVSHVESTVPHLTVGSIMRGCIEKGSSKEQEGSKRRKSKTYLPHHALVLHKEGPERLYTDGLELRLPLPQPFHSHSFIGLKNWTVYSEVDLSGRVICLVNPKSALSEGFNTILPQKLIVGSVKRGCETDPVPELITPPPEVMDKQTDVSGARRLNKSYSTLYLSVLTLIYGILCTNILCLALN